MLTIAIRKETRRWFRIAGSFLGEKDAGDAADRVAGYAAPEVDFGIEGHPWAAGAGVDICEVVAATGCEGGIGRGSWRMSDRLD